MSDLRQRETDPRAAGRSSADQVGAGSITSLPDPVDDRTDDAPPTLAAMTPRARSIALLREHAVAR